MENSPRNELWVSEAYIFLKLIIWSIIINLKKKCKTFICLSLICQNYFNLSWAWNIVLTKWSLVIFYLLDMLVRELTETTGVRGSLFRGDSPSLYEWSQWTILWGHKFEVWRIFVCFFLRGKMYLINSTVDWLRSELRIFSVAWWLDGLTLLLYLRQVNHALNVPPPF
jgi:hypothetical protein